MQTYEYQVVSGTFPGTTSSDATLLNTWGRDGWELVAIDAFAVSRWFYFKRPAAVAPVAQGRQQDLG